MADAYEYSHGDDFSLTLPSDEAVICVVRPESELDRAACESMSFDVDAVRGLVPPLAQFAAYVVSLDETYEFQITVLGSMPIPPIGEMSPAERERVARSFRETFRAQQGIDATVEVDMVELHLGEALRITAAYDTGDPIMPDRALIYFVPSDPPLTVGFNTYSDVYETSRLQAEAVMATLQADTQGARGAASIVGILLGSMLIIGLAMGVSSLITRGRRRITKELDDLGDGEPVTLVSIFAESFSLLARNLLRFGALTLITYSPLLALIVAVAADAIPFDALPEVLVVGLLGGYVLGLWMTGCITYGVLRDLNGEEVGVGRALSVGLRRFFPILGVVALMVLVLMGGGLVGGIVGLGNRTAGTILTVVLFVLLMAIIWLAIPVVVVERPGVRASLERSRQLTGGHRATSIGILIVLFILEVGMPQATVAQIKEVAMSQGAVKAVLVTFVGVSILAGLFRSTVTAVAYHQLRTRKEGAGIDELVAVFE